MQEEVHPLIAGAVQGQCPFVRPSIANNCLRRQRAFTDSRRADDQSQHGTGARHAFQHCAEGSQFWLSSNKCVRWSGEVGSRPMMREPWVGERGRNSTVKERSQPCSCCVQRWHGPIRPVGLRKGLTHFKGGIGKSHFLNEGRI